MENKYYLYCHIRIDNNETFYIGVGTKKNHKNYKEQYARAYLKANRNPFWLNITNKTKYDIKILLESNDYDFILNKEKEYILLYGRRDLGNGTLVNLTDGGEGVIGKLHPHSDETKQKISQALKGKPKSEEHKQKLSLIKQQNKPNFWKNKTFSKEHKQKLSESNKGKSRKGAGRKSDLPFKNPYKKNYRVLVEGQESFYYLDKKSLYKLLNISYRTLDKILRGEKTPKLNIQIYEQGIL